MSVTVRRHRTTDTTSRTRREGRSERWMPADDIRFDYVASLQLARRLWSLADTLNDLRINRHDKAAAGAHRLARQRTARSSASASTPRTRRPSASPTTSVSRRRTVGGRWAEAMNEQNRSTSPARSKRVEDDRNLVEDIWRRHLRPRRPAARTTHHRRSQSPPASTRPAPSRGTDPMSTTSADPAKLKSLHRLA